MKRRIPYGSRKKIVSYKSPQMKHRSPAAASLRQHGKQVVPAKTGGRFNRNQKHKGGEFNVTT